MNLGPIRIWNREKRRSLSRLIAKPEGLQERNAAHAAFVSRRASPKKCDRRLSIRDWVIALLNPLAHVPGPNVPKPSHARQDSRLAGSHQCKLRRIGEMPLLVSSALLDFVSEKILHEVRPLPDE